ncbi:MAG: hypothetical protein ACI4J0_12195 [Huintestinicola sp.]|uniref:hypothetical protein n=1 Tax=Huintestinicola sp. TaxID=2981661 RepID=UPI003F04B72A
MDNKMKKALAALAAVCLIMTGCGKNGNEETSETTEAAKPDFSSVSTASASDDVFEIDGEEETVSFYTGREVENEEDLAIFKFNCTLPDGYETVIDNAEGKQYSSPVGGIVVKAQNFKEEFQDLEVFADSGCASIKVNNMLYQADTEFSEPVKTTVAGFDAIRYDYTVTSYIFPPVTDENGEYVKDENDQYVLSEEKEINGEYVDRVYYFYSDEDVFYIICEAKKENAEAAQAGFDEFIESVTISKK